MKGNTTASREQTYTTTLDHQPRRNNGGASSGNKSSSNNTTSDESHVEERLRALIAMLGTTKTQDNSNEKDSGVGEDRWSRQEDQGSKESKPNLVAPNRGTGLSNLEPLLGGNLPTDEQGTLQYLSQLESVARRLKDQLLLDQQKVCKRNIFYYLLLLLKHLQLS